jgi:hypothetical protein
MELTDEELSGDVLPARAVPVVERRRRGRRGSNHRGGASASGRTRQRGGEGRGGAEAERHGGRARVCRLNSCVSGSLECDLGRSELFDNVCSVSEHVHLIRTLMEVWKVCVTHK